MSASEEVVSEFLTISTLVDSINSFPSSVVLDAMQENEEDAWSALNTKNNVIKLLLAIEMEHIPWACIDVARVKPYVCLKASLYFFTSASRPFEPHILEAFKASKLQYLWDICSTSSYHFVSILFEIFVVYIAVSFQYNTSDLIAVIILHLRLLTRSACVVRDLNPHQVGMKVFTFLFPRNLYIDSFLTGHNCWQKYGLVRYSLNLVYFLL